MALGQNRCHGEEAESPWKHQWTAKDTVGLAHLKNEVGTKVKDITKITNNITRMCVQKHTTPQKHNLWQKNKLVQSISTNKEHKHKHINLVISQQPVRLQAGVHSPHLWTCCSCDQAFHYASPGQWGTACGGHLHTHTHIIKASKYNLTHWSVEDLVGVKEKMQKEIQCAYQGPSLKVHTLHYWHWSCEHTWWFLLKIYCLMKTKHKSLKKQEGLYYYNWFNYY